jgi:phosphoglycolate phosphatase
MHKKFEATYRELNLIQLRRDLLEIADRHERAVYEECSLRAGAAEGLRSLKTLGYHMALVTNNSRRTSVQTLDRFLLSKFFDLVVTRDDVSGLKPSPAGILNAISFFHAARANTYYVGDSIVDVMAAKAADVKVIILRTGNGWDGQPQPDYWAVSLSDAASLISADTNHS